jgi:hypothetical protein
MTSITKQVWRIIDEDPSIRKDLARGIVNVSGLAAWLKEKYAIEGSLDSLISAIRRYNADDDVSKEYEAVQSALAEAVVSTKTRITALHLKNSTNLYKYLGELMKDPEFYKSEIFRLLKTRNETLCFIDKESLDRAKTFFPEGNIVEITEGLAELALGLSPEGWAAKGVMGRLANEIANYDVNILAIISAEPKISIFIKETDLTRSHEAVLSLTGH